MRKLTIIVGLMLAAAMCFADPAYVPMEVRIGTDAGTTNTVTINPNGYLDEILFQAPTKGGVTSVVTVVSVPGVGTGMVNTVLFTNAAMAAADVVRPRVAQDDNTGAALSSLAVAERYFCNGDPVTLRVLQTSGVTGVVFKVWLKLVR